MDSVVDTQESIHTALVTGATGTIGSRVARRLDADGVTVRAPTRSTDPPFDWGDETSWSAAVEGADGAFLLLPEGASLPPAFLEVAASAGVHRVVLLSDRNASVMRVSNLLEAEDTVRASGLDFVIVRPDWFQEDFETFFRDPVAGGRLVVPVGEEMKQDFVSAADIGEVAAVALQGGYSGRTLDVTGAETLTFPEALALISDAIGRPIAFDGSALAYREQHREFGRDDEDIEGEIAAYRRLADGDEVQLTSTVQEVLGRPPHLLADYVREAAERGVWDE